MLKLPRAFTLVELLVVVTIMVILISILLPAMENAVAQAQLAKCLAQLHGSTVTMRLYAGDNKGFLPPPRGAAPGEPAEVSANGRDGNWWLYTWWVKNYAGNLQLFQCPSDVGWPGGTISPNKPLYMNPPAWTVSYYLSIGNIGSESPNLGNLQILTLPQPSKTAMMCDWPGVVGFSWHKSKRKPGEQYEVDPFNAFGFVDGHAELIQNYKPAGTNWTFTYKPPTSYKYVWLPD